MDSMYGMVSVIIPIYNCDKYLAECLDSVVSQTYRNTEIILVDDGSIDKSGQICDEYAATKDNITVIHKRNSGVSSARNVGLDRARGNYIYFCDSDDILDKKILQCLVSEMESSGADLVSCQYTREKSSFPSNKIGKSYVVDTAEFVNIMLCESKYSGFLWNKMFRKDQLIGLRFNENVKIFEDLLFCLEYLKKCQKVVCIENILYYYRDNPAGACRQKVNTNVFSAMIGRDLIIDILMQMSANEDYIAHLIQEQIYSCCVNYWNSFKLKKDKTYWRNTSKVLFNKKKSLLIGTDQWSVKQKFIFGLTKILIEL